MRRRLLVLAALAGAVPAGQSAVAQAAPPADSLGVAGLPLVEVPAQGAATPLLAIILTGDGGWAAGDRQMAAALAGKGIPVVGLDVPSYLRTERTPDGAGRDLARLLEQYLRVWRKQQVLLIGYSHGADLAPFMVSRLDEGLRQRIVLLAMVGLEDHASFRFHMTDVIGEISRAGDLPVRPEVEKLRGLPMLCIRGADESGSPCGSLDPSLAQVETHAGGHRVAGSEAAAVVDQILSAAGIRA